MAYILQETGTLAILSRVQAPQKTTVPDLPSWVLDFSVNTPIPFLSLHSHNTDINAADSAKLGFEIEDQTLRAHALYIGKVIAVGESQVEFGQHETFEGTAVMVLASATRPDHIRTKIDELRHIMLAELTNLHGGQTGDDELQRGF